MLSRSKVNLTTKDTLDIRWHDGGFRVDDPHHMSMSEKCDLRAREAHAEAVFLDGLDKLTAQHRHTSHSDRASNWAPKEIIEAGFAGNVTRKELTAAMNRLLGSGVLIANADLWPNKNRHWATGIKRTATPPTCAKVPHDALTVGPGMCACAWCVPPLRGDTHPSARHRTFASH